MSVRFIDCEHCGQSSARYECNGCGANVGGQEDAVRIEVTPMNSPSQRTQLDYCHGCAVQLLPAAVGVGPGSDLPASLDPPEQP